MVGIKCNYYIILRRQVTRGAGAGQSQCLCELSCQTNGEITGKAVLMLIPSK